ncbi:hypothetical protein KR067_001461 [Drosophila pandora]|nr:hypothetical protein KR067_001461 [Drosophila pandora]
MAPHPKAQKPNYPPQGIASYRCRVCRGVHALRKCQQFLKLTAEKRLRAVLINKYCSNCLAHEHSGRSCRSAGKCRLCQRDHHTLLHLHNEGGRRRRSLQRSRSSRMRSPSRSPHRHPLGRSDSDLGVEPLSSARPNSPAALQEDQRGAYTTTLSTLLQHKATSVLPTAEVVINTGVKKFELKALIDPCCPTSRISASLARSLGLSVTSVGTDGVCTARLQSIRGPLDEEVIFHVDSQLQQRSPAREIDPTAYEAFANLALADERWFRPSTIFLVLGAEVYPHIIRSGFIAGQRGSPVAQNSAFGWILSGPCSH